MAGYTVLSTLSSDASPRQVFGVTRSSTTSSSSVELLVAEGFDDAVGSFEPRTSDAATLAMARSRPGSVHENGPRNKRWKQSVRQSLQRALHQMLQENQHHENKQENQHHENTKSQSNSVRQSSQSYNRLNIGIESFV